MCHLCWVHILFIQKEYEPQEAGAGLEGLEEDTRDGLSNGHGEYRSQPPFQKSPSLSYGGPTPP